MKFDELLKTFPGESWGLTFTRPSYFENKDDVTFIYLEGFFNGDKMYRYRLVKNNNEYKFTKVAEDINYPNDFSEEEKNADDWYLIYPTDFQNFIDSIKSKYKIIYK